MSIPTNEDDLKTATWIVGKRGCETGVYVTASDIAVKHGRHVRGEREGQMMTFVRENCPRIPVPKVYGSWKGERDIEYLAMSRMPGTMLSETWPTMDEQQRKSVLKDLEAVLDDLRKLRAPDTALIGPLDGGPAGDARGSNMEYGGPFKKESDFNEWQVSLIHSDSITVYSSFFVDTIRNALKRNHQLRFTHGDLGPHNILVEGGRVTAIIDWEFAGWYPEYWEYVKMIQFSRSPEFRCFIRLCWKDERGNQVLYDEEYLVDQMLDGQVRHGQRILKRPR